ncbi:hypothetical protein KM427_24575 [Nocardioides sp. LMS-CY]|uniref:ABM domain-containing protein n=1 Tax=Nocardioides soli TaxID=1036020 RepID=A0A7W4W0X1_9ACTN|nr:MULTISPECIES: hypothetical protein [Nocardioides]MBB3045426.1 hypothetical protein [Nocardioides soli]QWF22034.1 hypothetical protein KM427_24575 [Nocardioides sp. LMS-CY]
MFIQIIQGRCTRQPELRTVLDRWPQELGPTAEGWLGGTYGFTDDDMFVAVVRFTDRELAMRNSERPEQSRWAEEMMALFDGPVEFHDCDDVSLLLDGGSDDAGFVQVIRGKVDDPERLRAMMTSDPTELKRMRPEILGATLAIEPDGTFTETVAFTDEASAREGESVEPPPDVRTELEYAMHGATFYDLHHPWFSSH